MLVDERNNGFVWALSHAPETPIPELLEIGCGDASIVSSLVEAGLVRRGVGIDILPEAVEAGRVNHPEVELLVADAAALPFDDARFDVVLASTVFSSIPPGRKRVEALRDVARVLKPGGMFVWYDMRRRSPRNPDVRPFMPAEIAANLSGYRLVWRSTTVAPPLARALDGLAPRAYPMLARIPLLRTHTTGVAIKPTHGVSGHPVGQVESGGEPFVSVLLPVRNERLELVECLRSLEAQTFPHDRFEVLIADASDAGVSPAIVPAGLDVQIIPNPERVMSRGLNLVADRARGDYLAIVSAHSALPSDYLERIAAVAAERGAANVGTRVKKVAGSAWGRAIAAATSSPLGVGGAGQHHSSVAAPADSAFPGFIAREAFDAVGGFNPQLSCNEDDEFNARLRAAGGLVWYEPSIEVDYRPRESLEGAFRQHFRYGRWKVAVARTGVPGYIRTRHLVPAAFVLGAVAAPVLAVVSPRLRLPVVAGVALYAALIAADGRRMAHEYEADSWRVAAAYPAIHAGYGLGFIRGLFDRGMPREG